MRQYAKIFVKGNWILFKLLSERAIDWESEMKIKPKFLEGTPKTCTDFHINSQCSFDHLIETKAFSSQSCMISHNG